jgi:hypothetical protein
LPRTAGRRQVGSTCANALIRLEAVLRDNQVTRAISRIDFFSWLYRRFEV